MARLRASWRTSLPVVQQPRNPQSESIARSPYQTACGGESQALRRECTVAGGDCRAAGEAQGCRPERSLPVWQRQKVQEVLPPLKGSPAAPTGPAVRKAPHKLAQSAASQILLATLTNIIPRAEGPPPAGECLRDDPTASADGMHSHSGRQ